MAELKNADMIWNRACCEGVSNRLPGDQALAAMLVFHSAAMNGGVLHALECLAPENVIAAELGYQYFGLDAVSLLLNEVKFAAKNHYDIDALEAELDRRYSQLVPDDSVLVERFELVLQHQPSDFAPV